jgi:hypothetical protein
MVCPGRRARTHRHIGAESLDETDKHPIIWGRFGGGGGGAGGAIGSGRGGELAPGVTAAAPGLPPGASRRRKHVNQRQSGDGKRQQNGAELRRNDIKLPSDSNETTARLHRNGSRRHSAGRWDRLPPKRNRCAVAGGRRSRPSHWLYPPPGGADMRNEYENGGFPRNRRSRNCPLRSPSGRAA